jgi:hypothetical protein
MARLIQMMIIELEGIVSMGLAGLLEELLLTVETKIQITKLIFSLLSWIYPQKMQRLE